LASCGTSLAEIKVIHSNRLAAQISPNTKFGILGYHKEMEDSFLRPVAVFDIDGTVFRSSLLIELVESLIAKGLFPEEARKNYETAQETWLNRKGEYEPFIKKVVESFAKHAKGLPYADVADIAGEIIEAKKYHTYRYTRDLIQELKANGLYILGISHSPKFIVDGFGYELGFDKTYGTFYETGASGRFTGTIEDEHLIMNKGAVLRRAVDKNNLTLHGSFGVGDTESDISMLEIVETPIAFNPNRLLYRHAKKHEWKVVVERKDVIYEV
jgi:HAD superfamily hydrolase (TIGR01490 family)